MSISSSDNETRSHFMSFIESQDLAHVQIKQEMQSLLNFLLKILFPDTIHLIPSEFLLTSFDHQVQTCYKLAENVKDLVFLGSVQKYIPLTVTNQDNNYEEINISVKSLNNGKDIIGKLINCDKQGIFLNNKESKLLFSLMVGGLRDVADKELMVSKEKISKKIKTKRKQCSCIKKDIKSIEFDIKTWNQNNKIVKKE